MKSTQLRIMKARLRHLTLAILAATLLTACNKLPRNGRLDGMWQAVSVSYSRGGAYDSVVNVKDMHVYLRFQLDLAQFDTGNFAAGDLPPTVYARFKRSGSTLAFHDFYLHLTDGVPAESNGASDVLVTDSTATLFQCLGIDGISATFWIDKLNDERMQLTSGYARLIFRKF